jgi:hypothetical protein
MPWQVEHSARKTDRPAAICACCAAVGADAEAGLAP